MLVLVLVLWLVLVLVRVLMRGLGRVRGRGRVRVRARIRQRQRQRQQPHDRHHARWHHCSWKCNCPTALGTFCPVGGSERGWGGGAEKVRLGVYTRAAEARWGGCVCIAYLVQTPPSARSPGLAGIGSKSTDYFARDSTRAPKLLYTS